MFEAIAIKTCDTLTIVIGVCFLVVIIASLLFVPTFIVLCNADNPVMWVVIAMAVFLGLCKKPKPSPSADD